LRTLGIFVKHPVPGQVKTRLACELGSEQAAHVYGAFVADLLDRFRTTADRRVLGFAPDTAAAHDYFRSLAGDDYVLWPQPDRTLGRRMGAFFEQYVDSKHTRTVLIGSDSPTLPNRLIDEAFKCLMQRDCVLGPATDGGYYLIGLRGQHPKLFERIAWSGPRVLQQTIERLIEQNVSLALLDPWYDVDTLDDLELLRGHLQSLEHSGTDCDAPATRSAVGL